MDVRAELHFRLKAASLLVRAAESESSAVKAKFIHLATQLIRRADDIGAESEDAAIDVQLGDRSGARDGSAAASDFWPVGGSAA